MVVAATVKVRELERPPAVSLTVTVAVPVTAMFEAGTCATSVEPLKKRVARPTPFHWTVDACVKPEPSTVRLNAAFPADVPAGEIVEIAGTEGPPPPPPSLQPEIAATTSSMAITRHMAFSSQRMPGLPHELSEALSGGGAARYFFGCSTSFCTRQLRSSAT